MFISILFSSPNVDLVAVVGQDFLGAAGSRAEYTRIAHAREGERYEAKSSHSQRESYEREGHGKLLLLEFFLVLGRCLLSLSLVCGCVCFLLFCSWKFFEQVKGAMLSFLSPAISKVTLAHHT